jgi:hypothetical protein
MPVVRLRLTEGEVCANPAMYTASEGRSLYKLLDTSDYSSCTPKVGDEYYDKRYTKIGSVKENRLFSDNGNFHLNNV